MQCDTLWLRYSSMRRKRRKRDEYCFVRHPLPRQQRRCSSLLFICLCSRWSDALSTGRPTIKAREARKWRASAFRSLRQLNVFRCDQRRPQLHFARSRRASAEESYFPQFNASKYKMLSHSNVFAVVLCV